MARASDDGRLRDPTHVKIFTDTRTHRKTGAFWGDPEFRGQFLGLLLVARDREPAVDGTTLHLATSDVEWITGRRRTDRAYAELIDLCWVMEFPMHVNEHPVVEVEVPSEPMPVGPCDPGPKWLKAEVRQASDGSLIVVRAQGVAAGKLVRKPPGRANVSSAFGPPLVRLSSIFARILIPNYPEKQHLTLRRSARFGGERHVCTNKGKEGELTTPKAEPPAKTTSVPPEPPKPPPAHRARARVRKLWPKMVERAARYQQTWLADLGDDRCRFIAARLGAGATEEDLLDVIDGYVESNGLDVKPNGWDPRKHFKPETLYQPSKFYGYLEAARAVLRPGQNSVDAYLKAQAEREQTGQGELDLGLHSTDNSQEDDDEF